MQKKTVIVTGGSSGIGKALAFKFGREGANIVIAGRTKELLNETIAELKKEGIKSLAVLSDVSQEKDCIRIANKAINQFGKIDILINNAGITMRATFEEVSMDVIHRVMNTNFYGAIYTTKACLPSIIQNKGSVIGISSIAGFRGLPGRVGYSASKFALQGFLEVLRTEMIYKGVHVMTVCPGFTASNIRKAALDKTGDQQGESPRNEQKMMTAEKVAKYIYKATMKRNKFLILTNQGKLTVWLNRLFPGAIDKMVFNTMAKEEKSPLSLPPKFRK